MKTYPTSLPAQLTLAICLTALPALAQESSNPTAAPAASSTPAASSAPATAATPLPSVSPVTPTTLTTRASIPATPLTPAKNTRGVPVSVSASAVSRDGRTVTASANCEATPDGNGPCDVSDSSTVTSEDGSVTVSVKCRAAADSTPNSYYSYKSTTTVIRYGAEGPAADTRQPGKQ